MVDAVQRRRAALRRRAERFLQDTSDDTSFLDTLIRVGKSLSLVTIAKGIEEVSQLKHVKHQGCEQGQGFLFCKPLPPEEIERIIKYGHYLVGGVQSSIGAVS